MILYTILAILYIITVVGNYKTLSNEHVVHEALTENYKLAVVCLILFAVFWPVVGLVNNFVGAFQR